MQTISQVRKVDDERKTSNQIIRAKLTLTREGRRPSQNNDSTEKASVAVQKVYYY